MHGRIFLICLVMLAGCTETPDATPQETGRQETPLGQAFDPALTGTIAGRVVWDGERPAAKESVVHAIAYNPALFQKPARFMTPHIPVIEEKSLGVANAVVYLKGIEPRRSRPWDHANVRVEFHERQLLVEQGAARSKVGFVLQGRSIEIVNKDQEYHLLRVRGSAFFALPLIEPNKAHQRELPTKGMVELTCGAGYYWLNAHLFVVEHPYYARTDGDGRYVFDRVPPGEYEIVCWLPSWRVERTERDPEVADVARWKWAPPQEQSQRVLVEPARTCAIDYRWSSAKFAAD